MGFPSPWFMIWVSAYCQQSRQSSLSVLDYICHYHFLRDIGNDLYGIEYGRLRSELRKHGVRASLRKAVKALEEKIDMYPELGKSLNNYLKAGGKTSNVMPSVLAYILSSWILDSNSELDGYGFPFDRAHLVFYQRLKTAKGIVGNLPAKKKRDKPLSNSIAYWDRLSMMPT